jgi:hypothetical protein
MVSHLSCLYLAQDLLIRTLDFAVPVLATMFLGLFAAGFLIEVGILRRISGIAWPIVSIAHLPDVCVSSFVVSVGSTVAANGMIARFRDERAIDEWRSFSAQW